jgi:hypothetical protein
MRTTATYTLRVDPSGARDLVAAFLASEGLAPRADEDWDGSALWGSCALRFEVSGDAQDYAFDVHIRELPSAEEPRCSVELRQDVRGYRGAPTGPRRSLVELEHLDDALRSALERHGVVEHVEQFI